MVHIFIHPIMSLLRRGLHYLALFMGSISLLMLILSFTSLPFWANYYLGMSAPPLDEEPQAIVILGGSGMPSENGLIRCYYGTQAALKFPHAPIIIALPGDTINNASSIRLMAQELIVRGIDSSRIIFENEGTNTRWEALNIKQRFFPHSSPPLLIVTSPAHMYRSTHTFTKVGFHQVGGLASFGRPNEEALDYISDELGGNEQIPDLGSQISLRYRVWTRLHIEISVFREYLAIAYYWLMDWI